jgi:hypothetical protein
MAAALTASTLTETAPGIPLSALSLYHQEQAEHAHCHLAVCSPDYE